MGVSHNANRIMRGMQVPATWGNGGAEGKGLSKEEDHMYTAANKDSDYFRTELL